MIGIDATTGRYLDGLAHLRQSIRDILTTPLGTRVMRRDYGSRLFALIDAPLNNATSLQITAATIEALARWEPRIAVQRVRTTSARPGHVSLDIEGTYTITGRPVLIEGLEVGR